MVPPTGDARRSRLTAAFRVFAAGCLAVSIAVDALRWRSVIHPDLGIAQHAADILFSHNWASTFARVPAAQMGPLAIAASRLPRAIYIVAVSMLAFPFLAASQGALTGRWKRILWLSASLGVIVPWTQFAWKGHADDALVLVGAALVVRGLETGRSPGFILAAWALAVLAKPTAVLILPAFWGFTPLLLSAIAVAAAVWLPFFVASPGGFLTAGRGIMQVAPHSIWGECGLPGGGPPVWMRPLQLGLSVGLGWLGHLKHRPDLGILIAFTVRSLLEMNPAPAYAASVVALALLADARTRRTLPVFTGTALVAFWTSQPALNGSSGIPRALAHVALLGLVAWSLAAGGAGRTAATTSRPRDAAGACPEVAQPRNGG